MSESRRSDEDGGRSVLDVFEAWYHVPALLLLIAGMIAIRFQSYDNFVRDGTVYFSGNDAWYHLREVRYTVRNWPATMPFDPWTNFPYGTSVGQFGTLFDQLVAMAALVVGLGDPAPELVAKTLLVAPAVFGALTLIPTYLIGERLGGRVAGLFGALLLALLPGMFLQRTMVGVADHNGAEPLFQALAVAALMVAFAVAEREKPVWELVVDRDLAGLERPLLWSGIAGIALAAYMWMWPPGVLLVGVVGLFVLLKASADVVAGESPEPVAFAGAVTMLVTGVAMLVPLQTFSFSVTDFSAIQPVVSLLVAVGAAFLAWLAREWEARDVDPTLYPVSVLALVLVGTGAIAALVPPLWNQISANLLRIVGFSAGAQTRTIAEAQPFLSPSSLQRRYVTRSGRIMIAYGFTFFTAAAGAVWLLAKPLIRSGERRELGYVAGALGVLGVLFLLPAVHRAVAGALGVDEQLFALLIVAALLAGAALLADYDAERLLVVTWAAFIVAAAFTQVRFNYYLAVVVAVLNAYLLGEVLGYLDLRVSARELPDLRGYQVIAVVAVVMLVLAPVLVVPMDVRQTGNPEFDSSATAWETAGGFGPGAVTRWDGSLRWMEQNTPREGEFGGGDDAMAYYGAYERTGDFDYPAGAYGVMSWWDYGHWITVRGERIPNANPFQQGARTAANYLLAPDEESARKVLAEQSDEGERTRFVMVDWKMATAGTGGSKFSAPVVFYDAGNVSRDDFYRRIYGENLRQNFVHYRQRYYESLMVRLYRFHGSARQPQPLVVDWERTPAETRGGRKVTVNTVPRGNESVIKSFDSMEEARAYAENDSSAQVGGIGPYPAEYVPALEHYRLVKMSEASAYESRSYQRGLLGISRVTGIPPQLLGGNAPSWVKTFERVPGATIEGSGAPPNATVYVSVPMESTTTNATFTYRARAQADEDGEFSLTVPYSTTGYDEYGVEEGYTNVSVRATGQYTFRTAETVNESRYVVSYRANASVGEGRVLGAVDGPKEVTLERTAHRPENGSDGNETNATGDLEPVPVDPGTDTDPSAVSGSPVDSHHPDRRARAAP